MAASMYTKSIHSDTVGRQTPLSEKTKQSKKKKKNLCQKLVLCLLTYYSYNGNIPLCLLRKQQQEIKVVLLCNVISWLVYAIFPTSIDI